MLRGRNSIDIVGFFLYFVVIMYLEVEMVGNSGCIVVVSVFLVGGGLWVIMILLLMMVFF